MNWPDFYPMMHDKNLTDLRFYANAELSLSELGRRGAFYEISQPLSAGGYERT